MAACIIKITGVLTKKGGAFAVAITRWTDKITNRLESERLILQRHTMREAGRHDHAFLELTYILRGPVEHTRDGVTEILSSGDYFIVDYGSVHSYRAPDGGTFENLDCLFLPELLDPVLRGTKSLRTCLEHYLLRFQMRALVKNPAHIVFHDDDGKVRELLHKMEKEATDRGPGYIEFLRCYLLEILLLTMRRIDGAERAAVAGGIGESLCRYVEEHYREDISLSALCEQMHYSLPYVSRRFREETGLSFVKYLQNYRVMLGCRLLASSELSLAEVADAVGYTDVKFFSALIRRETGLSPSAFRKQTK